ncbi:Reverse transcriptase protein [Fusarium oxysporum f. sp. albedinis]|nr:Uncharacterized protein HZ326_20582 [Fusarium oxysporum f. sp. albedinis]KAJ0136464.1 Reverse transcriptase protein [Fusarium oxysporum f. sp. albedinis]
MLLCMQCVVQANTKTSARQAGNNMISLQCLLGTAAFLARIRGHLMKPIKYASETFSRDVSRMRYSLGFSGLLTMALSSTGLAQSTPGPTTTDFSTSDLPSLPSLASVNAALEPASLPRSAASSVPPSTMSAALFPVPISLSARRSTLSASDTTPTSLSSSSPPAASTTRATTSSTSPSTPALTSRRSTATTTLLLTPPLLTTLVTTLVTTLPNTAASSAPPSTMSAALFPVPISLSARRSTLSASDTTPSSSSPGRCLLSASTRSLTTRSMSPSTASLTTTPSTTSPTSTPRLRSMLSNAASSALLSTMSAVPSLVPILLSARRSTPSALDTTPSLLSLG